MNSKLTVVLALLLAFAACDAKFHTRDDEQSRMLPRLDVPALPTCGGCVITKDTPLQDLFAVLKDLGPTIKTVVSIASTIFGTNITNVDEMKAHITKVLQDGKAALSAYFGKVSAASANVSSCPALKTALEKLVTNLEALIDEYIQYWPTFVAAVDTASVMDAYRKTMVNGTPKIMVSLGDIIYSTIQVSGSALCTTITPVFKVVFDPSGVVIQEISEFASNGGSAATAAVNLLAGAFMPGGKKGGPLDQFEILRQTACGLLTTALVGSDLGKITGGFCPPGAFDPLKLLVGIFCALLDVIDPDGSEESCATDSSGGVLLPLVCRILGLFGLCSGEILSSVLVQYFTAVICRIVEALGGPDLPMCLSG